jgi:hypothetical protein
LDADWIIGIDFQWARIFFFATMPILILGPLVSYPEDSIGFSSLIKQPEHNQTIHVNPIWYAS